jgi:hypothetical protein
MTINTKFNIGQPLHFINPDTMKAQCAEVWRIDTEYTANEMKINYWFSIDSKFKIIKEDGLFATREELLESL